LKGFGFLAQLQLTLKTEVFRDEKVEYHTDVILQRVNVLWDLHLK
jgi:hypothetical protein